MNKMFTKSKLLVGLLLFVMAVVSIHVPVLAEGVENITNESEIQITEEDNEAVMAAGISTNTDKSDTKISTDDISDAAIIQNSLNSDTEIVTEANAESKNKTNQNDLFYANSGEEFYEYSLDKENGLIYHRVVINSEENHPTVHIDTFNSMNASQILPTDDCLYILNKSNASWCISIVNLDKNIIEEKIIESEDEILRFGITEKYLYYLTKGVITRYSFDSMKYDVVIEKDNIYLFWLSGADTIEYMGDDDIIYKQNIETGCSETYPNVVSDIGDAVPPVYNKINSALGGDGDDTGNNSLVYDENGVQAYTAVSRLSLRDRFPAGKYWNHVGYSDDGSGNRVTTSACWHHNNDPSAQKCGFYINACDCNLFKGCIQCWGFATKLAYEYYGQNFLDWKVSNNESLDNLKAGDVVRGWSDNHSIWITKVNRDSIEFADCNYLTTCQIRWDVKMPKSEFLSKGSYKIYHAPYEAKDTSEPKRWMDPPPAFPADGMYRLVSALDSNYSLDINGNSRENGANVQLAETSKFGAQFFSLKRDTNDSNYYYISHVTGGKYLDVYGGGYDNGTNVQMYQGNGSNAQKWCFVGTGDGYYYLVSKQNGLCLDVEGSKAYKGANAVVYNSYWYSGQGNLDKSQKWKLVSLAKNEPIGVLDKAEGGNGNVRIKGWAFDFNDIKSAVQLHVYVGGPAGSGAKCYKVGPASAKRTDVNDVYGCGTNHGFDYTFNVSESGTKDIYVYAINIPSGNNPCIAKATVNIKADTTKPTISNVKSASITPSGFTISCTATDNKEIKKVQFKVQTENKGSNASTYAAKKSGNTYSYSVLTKNHNNETGCKYNITVYAYDAAGNSASKSYQVSVPASTYTVKYNANGGTNAPSNQTKKWNETLKLSNAVPKRDGYKFNYWVRKSDSKKFNPCDSYTDNSNAELVAVWKRVYTIKYSARVKCTNIPSNQTKIEGEALKLSTAVPKKDGWGFGYWQRKSDQKKFKPGDIYTDDCDAELEAVIAKFCYKIKYNANGGTDAPSDTLKEWGSVVKLSKQIPKKDGYTFSHWERKSDSKKFNPGDSYTDNSDVEFVAVWVEDSISDPSDPDPSYPAASEDAYYRVVFKGNKATGGEMQDQGFKKNTPTELSRCGFSRTGYIFKNWNTKKDGSGKKYNDGQTVNNLSKKKNGKVTLYAMWKPITYNIEYDGNGAMSGNVKASTDRKYGMKYYLPANKFKRTGYKFVGWSLSSGTVEISYKNKAEIKNLTTINGDVVRLYAQWEPVKYKIIYHTNKGKLPDVYPKTHTVENITQLPQPVRSGYIFDGWYTDKKCRKNIITEVSKGTSKNVEIYAKWIKGE